MSRPCIWLTSTLVALCLSLQLAAIATADEPSSKPTEKKSNLPSPLSWPPGKVIFEQSESAKQIREALEQPIEFDFTDAPLADVIEFLDMKHEFKVDIDFESLAADGKGGDLPITKKGKFSTLANGLSRVFDQQGLTYLVKHDVLLITTKSAGSAPENLSTRVYQVHDLVVAPNDPTGLQPDFDSLVDVISSSIRQQDWMDNGGTIGFIKPFNGPGTLALIITHDEQGHREIEQLLKMLRESRVQQVVDAQEKQPFRDKNPQQAPIVYGVSNPPPASATPAATTPAASAPPPGSGGGFF